MPDEDEVLRRLAVRAVRARGALTEAGLVEHWRLRGGTAGIRPHVDAVIAAGEVRRLAVDDGGPAVLVAADADPEAAAPAGAVLLSPFDNLLWDRPFAERVLGFRHLIEVYKPAPERGFGYYVLPLLGGDRIVGRADVKADRKAGTLTVRAWHPEGRFRSTGAARAGARPARVAARSRARWPARLAAMDFETRAIHTGQEPDPDDRGGGRADLPDLDLRPAGRGRFPLRLLAHRNPTRGRSRSAWPRSSAPATALPSPRAWPRRPP